MRKYFILAAICAMVFAVLSCKKTNDSWTATAETLAPTEVTGESACLNARITWKSNVKHACEAGILCNTESGVTYHAPGVVCIRKDIEQQEGSMEIHENFEHVLTTSNKYYYVAYFRIFIGDQEKFIYGKEVSYNVPGK